VPVLESFRIKDGFPENGKFPEQNMNELSERIALSLKEGGK
jgi:hypothetical protein